MLTHAHRKNYDIKAALTDYVGALSPAKLSALNVALRIALDL